MLKITIFDNTLNRKITFYTKTSLKTIEDINQKINLTQFTDYFIVSIEEVNNIMRVIVRLVLKHTYTIEDILFNHYKYLII